MIRIVYFLCFSLLSSLSIKAQSNIEFGAQDRKIIDYHISDINQHKNNSLAVREIITEVKFLEELSSNELKRSEYWLIQVLSLYELHIKPWSLKPKPNFEVLKEKLSEHPYKSKGFYFEEAFIFNLSEETENYTTIELIRPYTTNCREIPNSHRRDKCTQKRIQFAIKQHFETNKAIEIFENKHGQIFVRDYEVTIYTSLIIDKKGKLKIQNISSLDKALDRLAKKAIKRFPKFEPARLNGKPIEAKFNLPITFTILATKTNN